MTSLASAVTKVLNPFLTSLATIVVVISVQQMPIGQKILWAILGVLVAAVPTLVLYFDFSKKKISSFWSPEGRQRIKSFWAWVLVAFVYALAAYLSGAPRLITALAVVLLVLGAINLIAAGSFKLSVHSELVTLLVLISILTVSVNLILLVPLIVLVGWARVYLKQHSLSEVTFGIFASGVAVYLVFALLGLATF